MCAVAPILGRNRLEIPSVDLICRNPFRRMRSSVCCVGEMTMQVPLAWQDPLPLTCYPDVDGDDVPPSPTPDPLPAPPLAGGSVFQRGFLDCAQEAVRFLTQEEGLAQDSPVVLGLSRHLLRATPRYTPPPRPSPCLPPNLSQRGRFAPYTVPSPCLPSSLSQRGRFAPYTVSSHCGPLAGCHRRELDKHMVSVALPSERSGQFHRCSASSLPSAHKIERVLADDFISSDDLQSVLMCLGSGSSSQEPQSRLQHSSISQSSTLTSSVFGELPTSGERCVKGEGKKSGWQCSSLDDSGIGDASNAELADEVDCVDIQCTSVSASHCATHTAASKDSVSVTVLDGSSDQALPLDCDSGSVVGEDFSSGTCATVGGTSLDSLPPESEMRSHHPLPGSSPLSHPDSSPSTLPSSATVSCPNSDPSSQLALLSSLSSGTHHLTSSSSADSGDATASRIQSLASQILLLLQEEADAQDYSDDDDDDDEGHQSEELGDSELEDSIELEAEP